MSITPWPLQQARRLFQRPRVSSTPILFEAGFGPSGPPHVGTLAECLRTSWVARAWTAISGEAHEFIVFSDDMDGLRRAPQGLESALDAYRGLPLCQVPDPSGDYESWGERNLALLMIMLDNSGIPCRIQRSSTTYRGGMFDASMLRVLEEHERIAEVVRPTLGEALRNSWTPFMPIHPVTGRVMAVPVRPVPEEGAIEWTDPADGRMMRTPVTGGHAKLGWKADWGMRWAALGVDWEMNGKDLAENRPLSEQICTILGGTPPLGMTAELLLDENGAKLSKSRGGGMTVEEWQQLGGSTSLAMFLMNAPEEARRFHAGLVPSAIDILAVGAQTIVTLENDGAPLETIMQEPAWYALGGMQAAQLHASPHRFPVVLGMARMLRGTGQDVLHDMLRMHADKTGCPLTEGTMAMAGYALAIVDTEGLVPRTPTENEIMAIRELVSALRGMPSQATAEELQAEAYRVGKDFYGKKGLRSWFAMLYEVLLSQPDGPRFGNLAELVGVEEICTALDASCATPSMQP